MKKKISVFNFLNGFIMVLISITMLYPFINTIAKSLSSEISIMSGQVYLFPVDFTWGAYSKVILSSQFLISLKNTLFITIVGSIISLAITMSAGFAFSRKLMGKRVLFIIVLITMFFSGGMIPLFLQVKGLGLYNTLWALILPHAFSPYNMILARNFFASLPYGVLESGTIDGCNDIKLFFHIALPMSKPILATLALFVMVGNWNVFMQGILYLDKANLYPLQVYVRNVVFGYSLSLDKSMAEKAASEAQQGVESIKSAVLMISSLPIICVYPFMQKYFVKGINMGAVKG
jgi:putative aldouronate transport system permease protein